VGGFCHTQSADAKEACKKGKRLLFFACGD
jgi:hypothetical protein